MKQLLSALAIFAAAVAGFGAGAHAEEPQPWQLGMQQAGSLTAERIDSFHTLLLWIITLVTLFVLGLLIYVMWRFRASRNPQPTRTSHTTLIEVLWTVVPIMILVIIAIPSFKLLYFADKTYDAELTLKATGHQWYWSYEYPDQKGLGFDSNLVQEADLKPGQLRLLTVNNPLVLPVDTNIRVLFTSTDVIHDWFMPSFGVQEYAIIGRLNESWFRIPKEGVYHGQCNQICGINHAFMPIEVQAVSKEAFQNWLVEAKKKFAHNDDGDKRVRVAANPGPAGPAPGGN